MTTATLAEQMRQLSEAADRALAAAGPKIVAAMRQFGRSA